MRELPGMVASSSRSWASHAANRPAVASSIRFTTSPHNVAQAEMVFDLSSTPWLNCQPCGAGQPHRRHRTRGGGGSAYRRAGLLYQGVQELPAGLLAAPAGLGADPAVRHVDMSLALVAAAPAESHARLPQPPGEAPRAVPP